MADRHYRALMQNCILPRFYVPAASPMPQMFQSSIASDLPFTFPFSAVSLLDLFFPSMFPAARIYACRCFSLVQNNSSKGGSVVPMVLIHRTIGIPLPMTPIYNEFSVVLCMVLSTDCICTLFHYAQSSATRPLTTYRSVKSPA